MAQRTLQPFILYVLSGETVTSQIAEQGTFQLTLHLVGPQGLHFLTYNVVLFWALWLYCCGDSVVCYNVSDKPSSSAQQSGIPSAQNRFFLFSNTIAYCMLQDPKLWSTYNTTCDGYTEPDSHQSKSLILTLAHRTSDIGIEHLDTYSTLRGLPSRQAWLLTVEGCCTL